MGGKAKAPDPPDYGPLLAANEKTASFARKLASDQWEWAKKVYDENKGLMKDTNESFLKTMEDARIASEEDRARYKSIYQPQEDRMVHDLNTYDTAERRDKEVGAAQANVAQQFDAQRDQSVAQLESYGVNPSATRFASLDIGIRGAEAASKAAAGTNAATAVEDKGRALRTAAIDIGKGYPGSYTAAGQLGVSAAANAQAGNTNQMTGGAQAMGTGPQWLGGSNDALANWGNALNQQYTGQLGQFNANQNASSGWGNALGLIGGMAMKRFGFAEGGIVPEEVSPSGGGRQDDVPVAVSVGEFVVPKETVSWFGEKHFHKLTEKAEQERLEQAVPTEAQPAAGGIPGRVGMAGGGMIGSPGFPDVARSPGFPDVAHSPSFPDNPIARSPGFPDVAHSPGFPDNPIARSPGFPDVAHSPGFPDNPITRSPGYPDKLIPLPRGENPNFPGFNGVRPLPGIMPIPGPPGGGMVPLPRGERPTFPGRPQIPGFQQPFTPIRQGPQIPGYRPPPRAGGLEHFPGIIPGPTLRPMSYHPLPPIPHYGPAPVSIPYGPDALPPVTPSVPYGPDAVSPFPSAVPYGPDAVSPPMRMRF